MKVGAIVQLKSGGPKMVVNGYKHNPMTGEKEIDKIDCKWFINNELKMGTFHIDTIKLVEDEK